MFATDKLLRNILEIAHFIFTLAFMRFFILDCDSFLRCLYMFTTDKLVKYVYLGNSLGYGRNLLAQLIETISLFNVCITLAFTL